MSNLFNNPDNLVDMVRQVLSGKPIEEKKEELDPVNKKAVKKKFDDRKDKDIDNDGDVDSTDKYLHKRRKAISKEINEGEGDQPCPHCKAMINAANCVKENKPCPECGGKINASHCEEVELDEENLEENAASIAKLKKAYEPMRGKKISPDNAKKLTAIVKKFDDNKDMLMKIAKADIPFVSDSAITRLIIKHNMKGAEIKAAMKEEVELDEDASNFKSAVARIKKAKSVKDLENLEKTLERVYNQTNALTAKEFGRLDSMIVDKKVKLEEETLDEVKDEDSDGEKMTAAQKKDMDGDGEKDKGEKKKKKKKDGEDDEPKADKINTEPETDEVKTMMSEDEMTDAQKAKLDKMKKKYEGGEMHKAMKAKYGDKADEVFYGKLTKMAMGESVEMNEDKKELGKISKELAGASKMHKGQSDRVKKIADKIDEAKDEEEHTNLIMQLRKAISLRGNKVTFADEKSVVVSDKDAQKFMSMFSKLKKPAEKEMLMKSAAKSHKHFKMALSGRVEKPKSGGLDLPKMKSEK